MTLKERKMEWISVKDRMPPKAEDVLFCLDGGSMIVVGMLTGHLNRWIISIDNADAINGIDKELDIIDREVTHWMPLPEPPKEQ